MNRLSINAEARCARRGDRTSGQSAGMRNRYERCSAVTSNTRRTLRIMIKSGAMPRTGAVRALPRSHCDAECGTTGLTPEFAHVRARRIGFVRKREPDDDRIQQVHEREVCPKPLQGRDGIGRLPTATTAGLGLEAVLHGA